MQLASCKTLAPSGFARSCSARQAHCSHAHASCSHSALHAAPSQDFHETGARLPLGTSKGRTLTQRSSAARHRRDALSDKQRTDGSSTSDRARNTAAALHGLGATTNAAAHPPHGSSKKKQWSTQYQRTRSTSRPKPCFPRPMSLPISRRVKNSIKAQWFADWRAIADCFLRFPDPRRRLDGSEGLASRCRRRARTSSSSSPVALGDYHHRSHCH